MFYWIIDHLFTITCSTNSNSVLHNSTTSFSIDFFPLFTKEEKNEVIKKRNHHDRAQEHKHRSKYPKHQRQRRIEQPITHRVQNKSSLQQLRHVLLRRYHHLLIQLLWRKRSVDEDVDLVDEPDRERVREEGEEEDGEDCDILESHHELPVSSVNGVV